MSTERKETLARKPINITAPSNVIDAMVNETRDYNIETGGLIFGLRYETDDSRVLIPLNCFTPLNDTDIKRAAEEVIIGGPSCELYQDWALLAWENIIDNSEGEFASRPEITDGKFGLLGMWHSHPSGHPNFSHIDSPTVDESLEENPFDDYLFVITNPQSDKQDHSSHGFVFNDFRGKVVLSFYHRDKDQKQVTRVIKPTVTESYEFPQLPSVPWYIRNENRYLAERVNLKALGYVVRPLLITSTDRDEPLIWLKCTKPDSPNSIYVGTDHNFDKTGQAFFTTTEPTETDFANKNNQMPLNLKDYGSSSIADIIGYYSFFTKINKPL